MICECGRPIFIRLHPKRNPKSWTGPRGKAIQDHELCRQCWRSLLAPVLNAQSIARSAGARPRWDADEAMNRRCWAWAFGALALTGLAIGLAYWWLHCPSLRAIGCL